MSSNTLPTRKKIKLVVILSGVSHFEVPLLRLLNETRQFDLLVIYHKNPKSDEFDSDYQQEISWGFDLLSGFPSVRSKSPSYTIKLLSDIKPDAVLMYGYGWKGALRIIFRNLVVGVPQIHRGTLSDLPDPRSSTFRRALKPVTKRILRCFSAHHFGGTRSEKLLLSVGVKKRSTFFVPYAVDNNHFLECWKDKAQHVKAKQIGQELGWSKDSKVLLFVAQHAWVKGTDIAMQTFRALAHQDPNYKFLVVGSGPETRKMKTFASKYLPSSSIHFAGFIPSSSMPPYYIASDLVLCSSRYETWARMINEAMIFGKSVVASEVVAAAGDLVVDEVTGFVVQEPREALFVAAISRYFLLSHNAKKEMALRCQESVSEYSYESHLCTAVNSIRYAIGK